LSSKQRLKVLHVVGARPKFMKVAPVMRSLGAPPDAFQQHLVHTGQHYDGATSQVFFDELEIAPPDENLEVGSGSHAAQTAQVMLRFEPVLQAFAPDWLVVVGDVNSTVACTLVASKLGVRVAHVEADFARSTARCRRMLEPVGYLDSIGLAEEASCVLTDSGGLQEETTFFRVPCLTLRPNTERPITLTEGSNRLTTLPTLARDLEEAIALRESGKTLPCPALWDGRAAERVADALAEG
jgi:UDP-N-acetylglucosamine 2-epimerase